MEMQEEFFDAIRHGQLEKFEELLPLLQRDPNFNFTTTENALGTPLACAIFYGRIDIVKKLIDAGVDVNFTPTGASPLARSIVANDAEPEIVRSLLLAGAIVQEEMIKLLGVYLKNNSRVQAFLHLILACRGIKTGAGDVKEHIQIIKQILNSQDSDISDYRNAFIELIKSEKDHGEGGEKLNPILTPLLLASPGTPLTYLATSTRTASREQSRDPKRCCIIS